MAKNFLILLNVLFFCGCTDDKIHDEEIFTKAVNFYGCDNSKSGNANSGCFVSYELLTGNYLKIIRQNERLNCSTDSVSLVITKTGNSIQIKEIQFIDSPSYCDCYMRYEYIIGPLKQPGYEVNILSPSGSSFKFFSSRTNAALQSICE